MNEQLRFELLALDPSEKTCCKSAPDLLHILRGNSDLWICPVVSEEEFQIQDGTTTLHVGFVKLPDEEAASGTTLGRAFVVSLRGEYERIEPLRIVVTNHLKSQEFHALYVLRDDVSKHIASQLYPLLYRLENELRGYLIKFMSTQVGPAWFEVTVSGETTDKVKMRKKNERVFGKFIENSAYLIDFGELGEIIYKQSSGFVTREAILKRIWGLPETGEAIRDLKKELQTNYQKYFHESFADREFQEKWTEFENLRNKIAHCNLFVADDLERGQKLAVELCEIIKDADKKTNEFVITAMEREAIQETAIDRIEMPWQITEDELLRQLKRTEMLFSGPDAFVGISLFVRHLTNIGYNYQAARSMIAQLEREGKVEVYSVPNPQGEFDTSAIKSVDRDEDG